MIKLEFVAVLFWVTLACAPITASAQQVEDDTILNPGADFPSPAELLAEFEAEADRRRDAEGDNFDEAAYEFEKEMMDRRSQLDERRIAIEEEFKEKRQQLENSPGGQNPAAWQALDEAQQQQHEELEAKYQALERDSQEYWDNRQREDQDRQAREREDQDREAREGADQDREALEREDQDREAREGADQDREARERADQDREAREEMGNQREEFEAETDRPRSEELPGSLNVDAGGKLMALAREPIGLPEVSGAGQNYPNPFNSATTIAYHVMEPGLVRLEVYDVRGQRVRELTGGFHAKGSYRAVWDGHDANRRSAASGVYFYALRVGGDARG